MNDQLRSNTQWNLGRALNQIEANRLRAIQESQAQLDALIAAQNAALEQAALAAAVPDNPAPAAAPATPPAPAAPASAQPAEPAKRAGPWAEFGESRFATQWLPTQTSGKRQLDLALFATLPFEERKKLADAYVASETAARGLDPQEAAEFARNMERVVYADVPTQTRAGTGGLLDNDFFDKAAGMLRSGITSMAASAADLVGASDAARGVRQYAAREAQIDQTQRFSPDTLDQQRQQMLRDRLRTEAGETPGALAGAGDVLARAADTPLATAGEVAGGMADTAALAALAGAIPNPAARLAGRIATGAYAMAKGAGGAREQAYQALAQEDFSKVPGYADLVKATGSEEAAKEALIQETLNSPQAAALQAGAGAAEAVGAFVGLEGLFGRTAANAIKGSAVRSALGKYGKTVAVETLEEIPSNVLSQMGENVAAQQSVDPLRSTGAGVAYAGGEGAVLGMLGGGLAAGVQRMADPGVPAQVPPTPAAPPVQPDGTLIDEGTIPADGTPPAPPTAPQAVPTTFASAEDADMFIDTSTADENTVNAARAALADTMALSDAPTMTVEEVNAVLQPYGVQVRQPAPPPADGGGTAASMYANQMQLDRRDHTGVNDKPLPDDIQQVLRSGGVAEAASVLRSMEPTMLNVEHRPIAAWLANKIDELSALDGQPLGVRAVDTLMYGNERAAGTYDGRDPANRLVNLDMESGLTEEVVMHEVTHALTEGVLRQPPSARTAVQNQAVAELDALHAFVASQDYASQFVIPDVREFISEGMNNPRLRAQMQRTPYTRTQSVWGKFKETLRGMLGMDTSVASDNAFESLLTATDALLTRVAVDPGTAAVRPARRAVPADVQASLDAEEKADAARQAQVEAQRSKVDFMEARYQGDSKDTVRGSAVLSDPSTDTWTARFFRDNGTVVETQVVGAARARNFLTRFGRKRPDGSMDRAIVALEQRDSGMRGVYSGVLTQLDGLGGVARSVYNTASRFATPATAYKLATFAQSVARVNFSRYGTLDALRPGGFNARNAFVAARAAAYGETRAQNAAGTSFRERADALFATISQAEAQGVPADVAADYLGALSALQRNNMQSVERPVDVEGRPLPTDRSKFMYWRREAGNSVQLFSTPTEGATVVEGDTAPTKFIADFKLAYGEAATATMQDATRQLREHNKYVLDMMLAQGTIGAEEHARLTAQDLYLPMQQMGKRASGFIRGAFGRTTKADTPLAQWRMVMDARIEHAYYTGALRDMVQHLQMHPNSAVATLNSFDRKPKPYPEPDPDTGVYTDVAKLVGRDWDGDKSVSVWVGDRRIKVTFENEQVAKALRPQYDAAYSSAMNLLGTATRMFSTALVGVPSFWLKSAAWDLVQPLSTVQGAYSGDRMALPLPKALQMTAQTYKNIIPALGDALRRSMADATGSVLTRSKDPLRTLYDSAGGGVALGQAVQFRDALLQLNMGTRKDQLMRAGRTTIDTLLVPGHVLSDAVRYASFRAFMEQQYGRPFKDAVELQAFADTNPEIVQQAIMGSKRVLGNYEDVGQSVLMRSIVPFYNASMVGATQTVPLVLGSAQGRAALGVIAGVAFFAALGAGDDDEDRTADGFGKRMRDPWDSLRIGDAKIPLPHELRVALAAGNAAAAHALNASGRKQDMTAVWGNFWRALRDATLPAPGLQSLGEDRPLASEFGPLGLMYMLAADDETAFGSARASRAADGKPLDPYHMHPNSGDSAEAVALSRFLFDEFQLNVTPTAVDMVARTALGGWDGLRKEIARGRVEGKSSTEAMRDWLLSGYLPGRENPMASAPRWEAEAKSLMVAGAPAQRDAYAATEKAIEKEVRGIGALNNQIGQARRDGDALRFQQLDATRKDMSRRADVLRKEYYETSAGAPRDLLQ